MLQTILIFWQSVWTLYIIILKVLKSRNLINLIKLIILKNLILIKLFFGLYPAKFLYFSAKIVFSVYAFENWYSLMARPCIIDKISGILNI